MTATLDPVSELTDAALLEQLLDLDERRAHVTVRLLVHLGEVDARRLYAEAGYSSLFAWCTEHLGWSESTAVRLIRVARAGRAMPRLLRCLQVGRLHICGAALLARHLKGAPPAVADALLDDALGLGKRAIEEMLATRFPKPPVDTKVEPTDEPAPPPPAVNPLAPDRYRVTFTAPASLVAKLDEARDLLAHAVPDGDIAVLFERGLDALLEATLKKRFGGAAARGAAALPPPVAVDNSGGRTRYIPMAIRATVWRRDEGRCTYVSPDGHCCGSRRLLELHHPDPYGFGNGHDLRITLRCRTHNQHDARQVYGDACIDGHIAARPEPTEHAGR